MTLPAAVPSLNAKESGQGAGGKFTPTRIVEVELTAPVPRLDGTGVDGTALDNTGLDSTGLDNTGLDNTGRYGRAWVLVRLHSEPLGVVVVELPEGGLEPARLAALIWAEFSEAIAGRFVAAGLSRPAELTTDGLTADPLQWPFLRRRAAVLADAPFISVVVCTRDRPEQIKKCLGRLAKQQYPRFEVVIVDNAPTSDALRNVVEGQPSERAEFRYTVEPRPGLSWARNAGIVAAKSDIIAFLDDDDEPDEHWLTGIADGFTRSDKIGCVSGIVLPARLDNSVELLFEEIGGHSKGRGFVHETFSKSGPQSPLYPLPPFGVGANMAFTREALDRIGGFDTALGAGTPTSGGEDTLALTLVLLSGYEIAYEHAALMWHHHRQDMASLNKQLHGYSVGLTAFYAALLRKRPGSLFGLLKLLPAAGGYLTGRGSGEQHAPVEEPLELPADLDRRQLQGMLKGPFAYAQSRRIQRRAAAAARSR